MHSTRRNRRGVTLIELAVTVLIASIVMGSVTLIFVNFGKNALIESSVSDVQLDLHSALGFMTDELRQARYIYNTDETSNSFERLRLHPQTPATETDPTALVSASFDKNQLVQAEAPGFRMLLAFWVPTVMGTARLPQTGAAATPGTPLAFQTTSGALVAWGTPSSIPAYNLVIYYATDPPPGSAWSGPRILERWESLPTPIRSEEFAEAEDPQRFLNPATFDSSNGPAVDSIFLRTLPAADGNSFVLADFLDRSAGLEVRYLSPQTLQLSLRGSLEGSQADRYLASSSTAQTYLRTNAGDALSYTTTVVARNVCTANAICPRDP